MRGAHFTPEHQQRAGKGRATQASFLTHNKQIAPDGFAAVSAYMRAPAGLRLLDPAHIQFLRPEQIVGKGGAPLSLENRRLLFGCYVWRMVWEHIPNHPPPPTNEMYLREMNRVQALIGRGQPLEDPLDGVYVAPNDFCNADGLPLSGKKQRKLYRAVLNDACSAALHRNATPRTPGKRRPMQDIPAPIHGNRPPRKDAQIGRPDLPPYAKENISPTRPYSVPTTANSPAIWLTHTQADEK